MDGLLILGFGGPTPGCCQRRAVCSRVPGCEAECFVSGILRDDPAQAARVSSVVEHYQHIGGYSPYNALSEKQVAALSAALTRRGHQIPIALGYRHWSPWAEDAVRRLAQQGCRQLGLLILSVHQSSVGWDDYIALAQAACEKVGGISIAHICDPFFDHPDYASAIAAQITAATAAAQWDAQRSAAAMVVFTAHAIPVPAEQRSPYRKQIEITAQLAAHACGRAHYRLAFQSQPTVSRVPWSQPSITEMFTQLAAEGYRDVIVQPCGFLVDHVEVLFDLDHDAAAIAQRLGLGFVRAPCVHDDPHFIALLAERVIAHRSKKL